MGIRTTVVGSYPKPPDEGGTFAVRKTLHARERGDATEADVASAYDDLARAVIAEQEAAGIDLVTDGHARWDDIVTPFAAKMPGLEIGGLLRFYDNNVYYRRPVCTGAVGWDRPCSIDAFLFAASAATAPVKAVVPGPVTFAHLSLDEHYGDHEGFVLDLARALAQEVAALEAAGARHIQFDEPSLPHAPEDLDLARRALAIACEPISEAEVTVATYFSDVKRVGAEFFTLPATVFALDFVSGAENRALVDDLPAGKILQAGIVDARNTKLEPVDELAARIRDLIHRLGADRVRVAPSAGLEYLPREKARAKLHRLVEAFDQAGA